MCDHYIPRRENLVGIFMGAGRGEIKGEAEGDPWPFRFVHACITLNTHSGAFVHLRALNARSTCLHRLCISLRTSAYH